jgi:hypothetical protein
VFPRPVDRACDAYQTVVREELETPLQPATICELKGYFERRRGAVDRRPDTVTRAFLDRGLQVFSGPRFALLYRRWVKHGEAVLESLSSSRIAEGAGGGRRARGVDDPAALVPPSLTPGDRSPCTRAAG